MHRLSLSWVPAQVRRGLSLGPRAITTTRAYSTSCGCFAKKQHHPTRVIRSPKNKKSKLHLHPAKNNFIQYHSTYPLAPTAEKGPKVSLTAEHGLQELQNLDKSVFEWIQQLDLPAQRRIASDLAIIQSGKGHTLYEKRNAAQSSAMKTGDPAAIQAAQLLTNAYIQSGNLQPYDRAVEKLSPETRTKFLQELNAVLSSSSSTNSNTSTRSNLHRAKLTILEEVPRKWKEGHLRKERDLIFMTDYGPVVKGKGASMLPTLPFVNTTFSAPIDDERINSNQQTEEGADGELISYNELTRAEAIAIVTKLHNEELGIPDLLKRMKPIKTKNIRVKDIVQFVATVPSGTTRLMAKRVTAVGGNTVDYQGETRIVPEGTVWVLGDSPEKSTDSRTYGAVPLENLRSKVLLSYDVAEGYFEWFGD